MLHVARLLAAVTLAALGSAAARADTITVNSTADRPDADLDDGVCDADLATPGLQCTLRAAVMHAGTTAGSDVIQVPAGTYALTVRGKSASDASAGDLDLPDGVSVEGADAATTIIDCKKLKDRAFDVPLGATAAISGLTIVNGKTPKKESGGAVRNRGAVTLSSCVLRRCKAADDAGGFDIQAGTATLTDVWIDACSAKDDGGGVDVDGGALTLERCTISGCKAKNEGGALEDSGRGVNLVNCTISGNASKNGGGISLEDGGTLTLTNCTVAFNKAKKGGGITVIDEQFGANTCIAANTIFASNSKVNSDRALTSLGGNVDSGATCGFAVSSADPLLAPLAANGGVGPTHAMTAASPAASIGQANCPVTDQRGVVRNDPCDAGAYEVISAKVR